MKNFFSFRTVAVVIVIVLICLGLAVYSGATGKSNPVSDGIGMALSPLQKGVSKVSNMVSQGKAYFDGYDALEEENAALKKKVSELEQELRDAAVATEENDRLRSLLGLQERHRSFELRPAEVIARSPGDWATTISLDQGANQGVAVNDLVVTVDGNMVGYVSSVAPTYCDVTTVIDTNMQAGALVTRTREAAIAEGDYTLMNEGSLRLSYLEPDSDVVIGDTVETSGRGGVFPKGVMIGTIERVVPEDNGISNYAVVKPFADVEKITNVAIVTDFEVNE